MAHQRAKDQTLAAFTAPVWLVNQAKEEAARRHMNFAGFVRYCLALEVGYSQEDARLLGMHMSDAKLIDFSKVARGRYEVPPHSPALNDSPLNSAELDQLAGMVEQAAAELTPEDAAQILAAAAPPPAPASPPLPPVSKPAKPRTAPRSGSPKSPNPQS